MRIIRSIFNSTAVNLNNLRISAGGLVSVVAKSTDEGYPTLVSHDVHRPLGWNFPVAMYFRPDIGYLIGEFNFPESEKEQGQIERRYTQVLSAHIDKDVLPHLATLKSLIGSFYTEDVEPTFAHCAAVQSKDLARKLFRQMFSLEDKDGLVPLEELEPIAPGVYKVGELVLFAHPFLRRSLSRMNTLNEPFLECLQDPTRFKNCTRKIALDPDMVGLASTIKPYIELQFWWGPKFSDDLLSIETGVNQHGTDSNSEFYSGVRKSEFWWYEQKGLKIFECEEVRSSPTVALGAEAYGCRFVHSIVTPGLTNTLIHADGAIRKYDAAEMAVRDSVHIAKSGRKSDYKKVWRVDGMISVPVWKELLTHYYRDNYLVGEYFGASLPQKITVEQPSDRELQLTDFVPVSFTNNDGPHVTLYFDKDESSDQEVELKSRQLIGSGDDQRRYIESDCVDLIKMLREQHIPAPLEHGMVPIVFDDIILNHPMFVFRGENARVRLVNAIDVFKEFFRLSSGRSSHVNQSVTIAMPLGGRLVCASFAGHITCLSRLMELGGALYPVSLEVLPDWADALERSLKKLEMPKPEYPAWDSLVTGCGQIYLKRRMLKNSEMAYQNGEVGYKASSEELEFFANHDIKVKPAFIVEKSHCTRCGEDYYTCPCIKLRDSQAGQQVDAMDLTGYHFDVHKI